MLPISDYILLFVCVLLSFALVNVYLIIQVTALGLPLTTDNLLFMCVNAHLAAGISVVKLVQRVDKVLKK